MSNQPATRVLFLCTGNSARSQMAEAIARAWAPGLAVESAGSQPAAAVSPLALRALAEAGISHGGAQPKHLSRFLNDRWDYVITVCDNARDACPSFPGDATRLHWGFDDPAAATGTEAERLAVFRRVRDEIAVQLRTWLPTVTGPVAA